MQAETLHILVVEDSEDDAALILAALAAAGMPIESRRVESAEAMAEALEGWHWDIVLSDYNLPRFSADDALAMLARSGHAIPFIIVSGMVGEEAAVEVIKKGATDFVSKSNLQRLAPTIQRSLREAETARQHTLALAALHQSEARFKAIAANIPGVVFQAICLSPRNVRITYISDRCDDLVGRPAATIAAHPHLLFGLVRPEDRPAFQRAWLRATRRHQTLNWEGRIELPGSGDMKWINVRASVRASPADDLVIEGIVTNITNNKVAEQELVRSEEQLRELSSHLQRAKEEERAHIAREIHDELGSLLTAAKIDLDGLTRTFSPDQIDQLVKGASIEMLLDQAMEMSQRISRSLRPGVLDYGIVAAVEWQAKQFEKRMGIPCTVRCASDDIALGAEASTALFRIFQETLTNITRHAKATHVWVKLFNQGGESVLTVADNGRGMTDTDLAKRGSFGIRGMRERAQLLGGDIRLHRRPEGGTEIEARLPRRGRPARPWSLSRRAPANAS